MIKRFVRTYRHVIRNHSKLTIQRVQLYSGLWMGPEIEIFGLIR